MNFFIEAIKDIGIFMIVCQTVLHFLPSGSTGGAFIKYGKPIAGLMVMLKICAMLWGKDTSLQGYMSDAITTYEKKWEEYMDNIEGNVDIPQIMQEQEEYNQDLTNANPETEESFYDIQISVEKVVIE